MTTLYPTYDDAEREIHQRGYLGTIAPYRNGNMRATVHMVREGELGREKIIGYMIHCWCLYSADTRQAELDLELVRRIEEAKKHGKAWM